MPRVIQVIESDVSRGEGKEGDPCRNVVQYHTLDGTLLAERDTWDGQLAERVKRGVLVMVHDQPKPMTAEVLELVNFIDGVHKPDPASQPEFYRIYVAAMHSVFPGWEDRDVETRSSGEFPRPLGATP